MIVLVSLCSQTILLKNRDDAEEILHQFLRRSLSQRRFYHLYAHLFPAKRFFEIAIPKTHQTIRIFDQDQINLLLIYKLEEFFQAFAFFIEARSLLEDERNDLIASDLRLCLQTLDLTHQVPFLFLFCT